jgi:hypothetical protein
MSFTTFCNGLFFAVCFGVPLSIVVQVLAPRIDEFGLSDAVKTVIGMWIIVVSVALGMITAWIFVEDRGGVGKK